MHPDLYDFSELTKLQNLLEKRAQNQRDLAVRYHRALIRYMKGFRAELTQEQLFALESAEAYWFQRTSDIQSLKLAVDTISAWPNDGTSSRAVSLWNMLLGAIVEWDRDEEPSGLCVDLFVEEASQGGALDWSTFRECLENEFPANQLEQ